MQVKWIPNDSNSNGNMDKNDPAAKATGPLPLSSRQREQLAQLEQAIARSPDPQSTLERVAEANGMNPGDLLSMLEQNRADLQQAAAAGGPVGSASRYPARNALVQFTASVGALLARSARRHPRLFVAVGIGWGLAMYVGWNAPRNGVVLSPFGSRRSILSSGPTTVWIPPAECCRTEILQSEAIPWSDDGGARGGKKKMKDPLERVWLSSVEDVSALLEPLRRVRKDEEADQGTTGTLQYRWLDRKALKQLAETVDVQQAAIGRAKIAVEELVASGPSSLSASDGGGSGEEGDTDSRWRRLLSDLTLDVARDVLHQKQLTEFSPRVKYHGQEGRGVLVAAGMGDWGRVGLLPVVSLISPPPAADADGAESDGGEQDSDSLTVHLVLSTVPGYHWEGEIHVVVSRDESDDVVVQVGLVVPPKRQAVPKSVAETIVTALVESILTSIKTRTRQSLSRSRQSVSFQRRARDRAGQRRLSRQRKERELEEMAADRRRRWQRQNPNAGHYRPSGDRMRSPNNAVYH
jgi:hypothetical protein